MTCQAGLLFSVLMAGAPIAPAYGASTCLLEVAGQRYMDGPCDAFRTSDGHLIISVGSGSSISYWAMYGPASGP